MNPATFKRKTVKSKIVFYITLLVIISTVSIIFLSGPKNIYNDTLTTISVISVLLFIMITIGLYKGVTFEDDMDNLIKGYKFSDFFEINPYKSKTIDLDLDNGPMGIIFSIIAWILISVILSILFSILIASFWALFVIILMALYWIFYRAVRLVFRKSNTCRGNILESVKYSLLYTVLYTIWFYAITYFSKLIKFQ